MELKFSGGDEIPRISSITVPMLDKLSNVTCSVSVPFIVIDEYTRSADIDNVATKKTDTMPIIAFFLLLNRLENRTQINAHTKANTKRAKTIITTL
jgi:hypothetical protein